LRTDHPGERAFARGLLGLAAAALALLGGLLAGAWGAAAGGAAGLGASLLVLRAQGARAARRRALLALPFPERWRTFLGERYDHYDRLPPELRASFEDDLRIFLAETRITGVDTEATEELRLLVGASAVTLSVGWPDYEWRQLTEVLLYRREFDRDWSYESRDLAGQAHPWGTIILSAPSLLASFEDPDDAFHVGIHEFAHLLDADRAHFDGIPAGLGDAAAREWSALVVKEMERLRKGKSVLDPYGAEDPAEFLGVAVEAFFEAPLALRARHREVYDLLAAYFRQDPAAWDDARGLLWP
jgi:Mlc titration factor MtfA (ptsG expression regulator)